MVNDHEMKEMICRPMNDDQKDGSCIESRRVNIENMICHRKAVESYESE